MAAIVFLKHVGIYVTAYIDLCAFFQVLRYFTFIIHETAYPKGLFLVVRVLVLGEYMEVKSFSVFVLPGIRADITDNLSCKHNDSF